MKITEKDSPPARTTNPRCALSSPAGRQCSQPVCSSSPTFCFTHEPPATTSDQILMQELTQAAGTLDSPKEVSRVLGKIFMALLQDRMTVKKAGPLGYLGQMLLRSHREIAFYKKTRLESKDQEEKEERNRIWQREQDRRRQRIAEHHAAEQRAAAAEEEARKARAEASKKREAKIAK